MPKNNASYCSKRLINVRLYFVISSHCKQEYLILYTKPSSFLTGGNKFEILVQRLVVDVQSVLLPRFLNALQQ